MKHGLTPTFALAFLAVLFGYSQAVAGDIVGTVTIKSALRARATGRTDTSTDSSFGYGGGGTTDDRPPTLSREQEVPFVVISVAGTNLPATPKSTYVMRQHQREFIPHVLPIVRGSSVMFTNEDPYLHSIYSETPGNQLFLPKYARGKKEVHTFTRSGAVELFCGIHSRMNAYIYVVDNDYYAQPGPDHRFAIRNVPGGTYILKIWHPRANPQTKTVTVPASGTVNLDLAL